MNTHIYRLMTRLIASQYFYKEYEQLALDWLEDQFKFRAAVQFRIVLKEAKRVATTSGIGQNSVLYRVLRDMLLAFWAPHMALRLPLCDAKKMSWYGGQTKRCRQKSLNLPVQFRLVMWRNWIRTSRRRLDPVISTIGTSNSRTGGGRGCVRVSKTSPSNARSRCTTSSTCAVGTIP